MPYSTLPKKETGKEKERKKEREEGREREDEGREGGPRELQMVHVPLGLAVGMLQCGGGGWETRALRLTL